MDLAERGRLQWLAGLFGSLTQERTNAFVRAGID